MRTIFSSFKTLAVAALLAIGLAFVAAPANATDPCNPCFGGGDSGGGTGWTSGSLFGASGGAFAQTDGFGGGRILQGTGTTGGATSGTTAANVLGGVTGTTNFCDQACGSVTGNVTATFGGHQQSSGFAQATSPTYSFTEGGTGARAMGGGSVGFFRGQ